VPTPSCPTRTPGVPTLRQRQALEAIACCTSGSAAATSLDRTLVDLGRDLQDARRHYGVDSTRAALTEARRLGHIQPDLTD